MTTPTSPAEAARERTAAAEGAPARPALIDGWIIAAALAVIAAYVRIIWFTPPEAIQGLAQKIYYLHLPAALNAYLAFGVVFVTSIV
jgi:hypothetical protein